MVGSLSPVGPASAQSSMERCGKMEEKRGEEEPDLQVTLSENGYLHFQLIIILSPMKAEVLGYRVCLWWDGASHG